MDDVDFSDLKQAEAWFEKQTPERRSLMASRAALRVLANVVKADPFLLETLAKTTLRCTLTSAVRGLGRTADVEWLTHAANSAFSAANSADLSTASIANSNFSTASYNLFADVFAVNSAIAAVNSAPSALSTVSSARFAALSAGVSANSFTTWDSQCPTSELMGHALWAAAKTPIAIDKSHNDFLTYLSANSNWRFFHDWYLAMWKGTFTNWDLATAVAKIPHQIWEGGLDDLGSEIARIEAEFLIQSVPQAEEIFKNEDGLYDAKSTVAETSKLMNSVQNRVRFAFTTAIESNVCDLTQMNTASKLIRHALEECTDDPNALEQFLRNASSLIKKGVTDGNYSEDDETSLLIQTLDETALQLRADHPEVAEAVETRTAQRLKEIDDAKRLEIAERIEELQEGTSARLSEEFIIDAEITKEATDPKTTAEAIGRSGNRAAKISLMERGKKVESSGAMGWTKIGLRAKALAEIVASLFGGG